MSAAGERVVLIDSDVRRPPSTGSQRGEGAGLVELLLGRQSLDAVLQKASAQSRFHPSGANEGFSLGSSTAIASRS